MYKPRISRQRTQPSNVGVGSVGRRRVPECNNQQFRGQRRRRSSTFYSRPSGNERRELIRDQVTDPGQQEDVVNRLRVRVGDQADTVRNGRAAPEREQVWDRTKLEANVRAAEQETEDLQEAADKCEDEKMARKETVSTTLTTIVKHQTRTLTLTTDRTQAEGHLFRRGGNDSPDPSTSVVMMVSMSPIDLSAVQKVEQQHGRALRDVARLRVPGTTVPQAPGAGSPRPTPESPQSGPQLVHHLP